MPVDSCHASHSVVLLDRQDSGKMVKRYLRGCFIAYLLGISCLGTASAARYENLTKTFPKAVVVSDSFKCSSMGKDVLKQHGSAVDAAIITVLCLGIIDFQSTGIGGGGHMTIYKKSTGTAEVIDFKETAPSGVKDSDFEKPWKEGEYFVDPKLLRGGTSIGIPGMLKGLELAHKRHGKYSWQDIFESAAKLAEKENHISRYFLNHLYEDIGKYKKTEFKDFREFLASSSDGNKFKQNALAKMLRTIAEAGNATPFYDGVLSKTIVNDVQNSRGTITLEDLRNYRAILREPVEVQLGDKKLYSTPPPAGGAILSSILNVLSGYSFSKQDNDKNSDERFEIYHKMIESFKWSYACTDLIGDPEFSTKVQANDTSCKKCTKALIPEMIMVNENIMDFLSTEYGASIRRAISADRTYNISHYNPNGLVGRLQGTTHVSVLAENGDAVAITSSLNDFFGSYVFSKKLGLLFNNQMKDFRELGWTSQSESPDTTANVIVPGKRIPSLMSPTIIVDKDCNVVMVIGAAGGTRIPSVVAQVIARYLWLGHDLQSSINEPRFHHQLQPNIVFVENDISHRLRTKLRKLGHKISEKIEMVAHYPLSNLARLNALVVERHKDTNRTSVNGVNDRRGGGGIDGY